MCVPNLKIMRPLPTVLRRLSLKLSVVDQNSSKFLSSRFRVLPRCVPISVEIEQIFPFLKSHLGCEAS